MKNILISALWLLGTMFSWLIPTMGFALTTTSAPTIKASEFTPMERLAINFGLTELSDGNAWIQQNFLKEDYPAPIVTDVKAGEAPCFAVMSDTHLGRSDSKIKVARAFKNLLKQDPNLDAIFVCGDLTDYGYESQYADLAAILQDRTIVPAHIPVYLMMGNHDNYKDHSGAFYSKLGQPLHQFITIKGYPFITISTRDIHNNGTKNHDEEAYNFLTQSLAEAAKQFPDKPIFVFDHYPATNTVYGSKNWGNPRLYDIMKPYPQVIAFSGHSHYPLSDPRSIHQRDFTSINDGTISYAEVDPGEVSEGIHPIGYNDVNEACIVKVDEQSNVRVIRWNTAIDKGILSDWNISAPHDGSRFAYNHLTGGENPVFGSDVKVRVSDVTSDQCKVTFKQATDDENVHHYLVEILHDGAVVSSYMPYSRFYLLDDMPSTLTVPMKGIPSNVVLKARVTAYDSFGNASEPILSSPFSTKEYKPAPGTSRPVADLVEVGFGKEGKVEDLSANKASVTVGENQPVTYFNELYNMYAASFDGSWSTFYKVNYAQDEVMKEALQNHFTFELLCKPNDTGGMCPFSGQESGGFGFEQLSGGIMAFYAHIGGGYEVLKSSAAVEAGKYYHFVATYDKAAGKLCLYMNGNPVDEIAVSGNVGFPADGVDWIGIGADAKSATKGQFGYDGDILVANMYNKAVTRDEVYWMYKYVNDKKTNGYKPTPGTAAPVADLFDLQFNDDGTATDISERKVAVTQGSTKPTVVESSHYDMKEAVFPGSYYSFYRIDYAQDELIKNALMNGFSIETLYSPANTDDICPFSGQESGGFGIEHDSKGTIQFYIRLGGGYKILKSNVQVVPGKYYHVITSYDKAAGEVKMYVNGLFAGSLSVSGDFGFPPAGAQWIGVGGDSHDGNYAQYPFEGPIAMARMYSKVVNRDDIYWMHKAVQDKEKSDVYKPNYDVAKPVADLLDLKFGTDGAVEDISPAHQTILKNTELPETKYNAQYNREEAVFTGSSKNYYAVDYSNNENIQNAFRNGFAFEVVYSTNKTNNVCPMSSQQYGGCGFEQLNGGNISFYINFTTSGSSLLKSNVMAVPGKYYHVVATYDKATQLVCLYVDGKLCAQTHVEGDFKFSSYEKARWIGIGGDSNEYGPTEGAQFCLDGSVMIARMYGKYLSMDEVYWLYNGLEGERTAVFAQQILDLQGAGYPQQEAACRNDLKAAIQLHADTRCTESDNLALIDAVNAYKLVTTDIQMPESGKAYQIVSVGKYGTKYYLESNETGSTWQTDANVASTYVCKDLGNGKFMLVNNAGNYFTWFGDAGGYNANKGYADSYIVDVCDLTVEKMKVGDQVAPFEDTDLFGLVSLSGKAADGTQKYITVGAEGELGNASAQVLDDMYSSSVSLQEVVYPNTPNMKPIVGDLTAIQGAKTIATFSAPFATVLPQGVSAFYIAADGLHPEYASLTKVEANKALPANQGVILTSENAEAFNALMVPVSNEEPAVLEGNLLSNTAGAAKEMTGSYYLLGKYGENVGFFLGNPGTLGMNKAYLPMDGAQTKSIKMIWNDEATGIESVTTLDANAPIYDLSGRRVLTPVKGGVYIQKGKKFIMK